MTLNPESARAMARDKTREHIKLTAALLFSSVGYECATMRMIAKKAGVSTGAIFSNWPNKSELWREITGAYPNFAEWFLLKVADMGVGSDLWINSDELAALITEAKKLAELIKWR